MLGGRILYAAPSQTDLPYRCTQAMDRAHRLGQTRTVNVYRLLTRGTLEERIMGLQRFKLDVANAVVNTDNASLASMDTSQILDLFSPPSELATQSFGAAASGAASLPHPGPARSHADSWQHCKGWWLRRLFVVIAVYKSEVAVWTSRLSLCHVWLCQ